MRRSLASSALSRPVHPAAFLNPTAGDEPGCHTRRWFAQRSNPPRYPQLKNMELMMGTELAFCCDRECMGVCERLRV